MSANRLLRLSIVAVIAIHSPLLSAKETIETCKARNLVPGKCAPYRFDEDTKLCVGSCIERLTPDPSYSGKRPTVSRETGRGSDRGSTGGASAHRSLVDEISDKSSKEQQSTGSAPRYKPRTDHEVDTKPIQREMRSSVRPSSSSPAASVSPPKRQE